MTEVTANTTVPVVDVVDVIIVTHNSVRDDIERCLGSLMAHSRRYHYRITVVDNASADGTLAIISARFPSVNLLVCDHNAGFAKGNNLALQQTNGQYVILLNPDTEVKENGLDNLVDFLIAHPEAGAAGPRLLNPDSSVQLTGNAFPSVRNLLFESLFLDRLFPRSRLFGDHKLSWWDRKVAARVDWVMGACIALRREVGEKVGWFDETFFMYFEEIDLCRRILTAGYLVYYVPEAAVVHYGGVGVEAYSGQKVALWHQSLFCYFHKHHPEKKLLRLRLVILVRSLLRVSLWLFLTFRYGRFAIAKALAYMKTLRFVFTGESL